MINKIRILSILGLTFLMFFSNINLALSQSCYSVTSQTLGQENDNNSGTSLFVDGYYWYWDKGDTSNYPDVPSSYDYQGNQSLSKLSLETTRGSSDPRIDIYVTKTVTSTSTGTDNGSCGSSTRLVCLQGGVCVNHVNDIWDPDGVNNGDDAMSYTRLSGSIRTDNNDYISDANNQSRIILRHKKESGDLYQNLYSYNNGPTSSGASYFSIVNTGWITDSDTEVLKSGVGLHFDVADTFNESGTIEVESKYSATVRCVNDGYELADAILESIAVRSAAVDVSSSGNCP